VAGSGGTAPVPDAEVAARPKRRPFTAEYERFILDQAGTCRGEGAMGAPPRHQGLYSSPLTTGRHQREQGELEALAPRKRDRKSTAHPLVQENQRLPTENARLSRRLPPAEIIIEGQKEVSARLGISLPEVKTGEGNG